MLVTFLWCATFSVGYIIFWNFWKIALQVISPFNEICVCTQISASLSKSCAPLYTCTGVHNSEYGDMVVAANCALLLLVLTCRQSKFSIVHDAKTAKNEEISSSSEITGLALRVVQRSQMLFVSTKTSLLAYETSVKDKNTLVCHQSPVYSVVMCITQKVKDSHQSICEYYIQVKPHQYLLCDFVWYCIY